MQWVLQQWTGSRWLFVSGEQPTRSPEALAQKIAFGAARGVRYRAHAFEGDYESHRLAVARAWLERRHAA